MNINFAGDAHETAESHLQQLVGLNMEWRAAHNHFATRSDEWTYLAGHGRLAEVTRTDGGWLMVTFDDTVDDFETFSGKTHLVFDDPEIGFDYDKFTITVY